MNHVRILEAFHDGNELVVRSTQNYDLEHRNLDTLLLLSRWWLGHSNKEKDTNGYVPTQDVLDVVREQNRKVKSRPKSKPKSNSRPESKPESKLEFKAELRAQIEAELRTELGSDIRSELKAEIESELRTEFRPGPESKPELEHKVTSQSLSSNQSPS
ncbi:hypothetical protein SI65_09155 [Aspergillus cristatus]|uniref:SH3 domain-containing protein n=1 Tax=Aspergillus cristatus TaxID=573508 RepID=A0A1E3B3M5_ASPCR|nr:hypothetical protein SI65_09155 [Aspergillus cristatus]